MKSSYIITFSLLVIVVVGVGFFIWSRTPTDGHHDSIPGGGVQVGGGIQGGEVSASAVIRRLEDSYEPKDVIIREGETVSFVNDSTEFHWPASDVHPTHSIYSEFDPREPIGPGETWSFTFDQSGTWEFHDHLRANLRGTITVLPVN